MIRFTIRDVLWLTVVVAIYVAWVLDHAQLTSEEPKSVMSNEEARRVLSVPRSL